MPTFRLARFDSFITSNFLSLVMFIYVGVVLKLYIFSIQPFIQNIFMSGRTLVNPRIFSALQIHHQKNRSCYCCGLCFSWKGLVRWQFVSGFCFIPMPKVGNIFRTLKTSPFPSSDIDDLDYFRTSFCFRIRKKKCHRESTLWLTFFCQAFADIWFKWWIRSVRKCKMQICWYDFCLPVPIMAFFVTLAWYTFSF